MKINNNCKYASFEERRDLLNVGLMNLICNNIECCVIKKDNVYYIIYDMWKDVFMTDEENINRINKYDFMIISKPLFIRLTVAKKNSFSCTDKIIIDYD